ncbi:MAG: AAA family ATPase [Candidatus Sabulitectum sp.]|nr:AAA family ATPase [Candidatus Sabulitectum sp.]
MTRYLEERIVGDLTKKMVLLAGPRQVGKTYLSKQIGREYFNRFCYLTPPTNQSFTQLASPV